MAKPICVIYIDANLATMWGSKDAFEVGRYLNEIYSKEMPDYHVFVMPDFNKEEPIPVFDCKVFYEKDFTEVQYQELKEIIEAGIKKQQTS